MNIFKIVKEEIKRLAAVQVNAKAVMRINHNSEEHRNAHKAFTERHGERWLNIESRAAMITSLLNYYHLIRGSSHRHEEHGWGDYFQKKTIENIHQLLQQATGSGEPASPAADDAQAA